MDLCSRESQETPPPQDAPPSPARVATRAPEDLSEPLDFTRRPSAQVRTYGRCSKRDIFARKESDFFGVIKDFLQEVEPVLQSPTTRRLVVE